MQDFRDLYGTDAHPTSWPGKGIACVWLPQLPLRVEVLRHPAWDGHPLVLGGGPGERKVVHLCSPEAERAGIRPGLSLREVLPLCNDAIILQPDPVRIATILGEVLQELQRVSPTVEPSEERLFLDLRGLQGIYHYDVHRLERAIRAAVAPLLRPHIGVADGKFTASIAARVAPTPGMRVVLAHETVQFLAPLPISYLPFPPDALERLDNLGLHTMADLTALPFTAVQAEFGLAGARAWRLANGQDEAPIVPHQFVVIVQASLRFDYPLASMDAIFAVLRSLLTRAFENPLLRSRSARQARLRALLSDGTSWERLFTFKEALSSKSAAYSALKGKLQLPHMLPSAAIEELAVELLELGGEAARQPSLFSAHSRRWTEIAEATRQLHARYGHTPLYRPVEVEPWSRIPERRWALAPYEF